jgi:hypothetical protein
MKNLYNIFINLFKLYISYLIKINFKSFFYLLEKLMT